MQNFFLLAKGQLLSIPKKVPLRWFSNS